MPAWSLWVFEIMTLVKGLGLVDYDSQLGPDLPVLVGTKDILMMLERCGLRSEVLGEQRTLEVNGWEVGPIINLSATP